MVCFVVLQEIQKLNGCAICNAYYFPTSSDIWINRSSSTTNLLGILQDEMLALLLD